MKVDVKPACHEPGLGYPEAAGLKVGPNGRRRAKTLSVFLPA
jgi:hypothetical protein